MRAMKRSLCESSETKYSFFYFLTLLAFTFYLEQYLKVDIIFNLFQLLFLAINFAIAVHQLIVFVSFVVYLYRCLLLDFDAEGEGAADLQVDKE